jgi:GNAT superfamily N-acetyltransferase
LLLKRLEPADERPAFCCGDDDLNEFYFKDSIEGAKELMAVTYALVEDDGKIVAFFSVSNDSLARTLVPKSILKIIPRPKRYRTWPATKIGRFGVCSERQGSEVGSSLLNFLKVWFTQQNKTGCRFLIVDAYNKERVIRFYQKNGFEVLPGEEEGDTKLMFFDLKTFRP